MVGHVLSYDLDHGLKLDPQHHSVSLTDLGGMAKLGE